ncbi:BRO-N domain-containing protein, partial [Limosilactobacillus fermentum]
MENKLQLFNFNGQQVRTVTIDDEPYFVGKDVAEILGYANTRDALSKHVDSEDKNTVAIHDGIKRGNPNQTVINESGLYSLILSSKLPSAKKFKRWVTSEVLPAIRKTGAYQAKPKDNYPIPATYGEALQLAATLQTKIEHDAPSLKYFHDQMRNP